MLPLWLLHARTEGRVRRMTTEYSRGAIIGSLILEANYLVGELKAMGPDYYYAAVKAVALRSELETLLEKEKQNAQ